MASSNVAVVFVDEGSRLVADVQFVDFAEAFEFVSRVAAVAEAACHHPDIEIRWNRVRLSLSTHDAGDVVTEQDRALAHVIEELLL
jgi:4a-hydroxytetrahydrobiopterin dehydratase